MFYIIYKITNTTNDKIYVGKHQTSDINDGYMGSGKLLKRAFTKYGKDQFTKEILHILDSENEMNLKEKEIVTEEFCNRSDTYNLCVGGGGGFSFINREGLKPPTNHNTDVRDRIRQGMTSYWSDVGNTDKILKRNEKIKATLNTMNFNFATFEGKKNTTASRLKISSAAKNRTSEQNSQFGTMWITDGNTNQKIKAGDALPDGFRKGRSPKIS